MEVIQPIELISIDPNVRGGRSCIAGTTLRVINVVQSWNRLAVLGFGGWRANG